MSRIYFHTPSHRRDVCLNGSERAHMGVTLTNLAVGLLHPGGYWQSEALVELMGNCHMKNRTDVGTPQWVRDYETTFSVGMRDELITWKGHNIKTFRLALNTAMAVGNDTMKLFARLHGQCEIHAYIEGPNRAWVADIIDQGLRSGLCRDLSDRLPETWEEVATMLRERDDEPVVTSYSVCSQFPNPETAGWMDTFVAPTHEEYEGEAHDNHHEAFYNLPVEEQWRLGMERLRKGEGWLEISPQRWDWPDYHFGEGLTVFDLFATDRDKRLDAAFKIDPCASAHVIEGDVCKACGKTPEQINEEARTGVRRSAQMEPTS